MKLISFTALAAINSDKHSDNQLGLESTAAIDTLLAEVKAIVTRLAHRTRRK